MNKLLYALLFIPYAGILSWIILKDTVEIENIPTDTYQDLSQIVKIYHTIILVISVLIIFA